MPEAAAAGLEDGAGAPPPSLSRALALVFTGGTSRASRCVEVTHAMALHELRQYPAALRLRPGERVLQLSSAYWGAALLGELDVPLSCGGTAVFWAPTEGVSRAADPAALWEAVRVGKVTVMNNTTTISITNIYCSFHFIVFVFFLFFIVSLFFF